MSDRFQNSELQALLSPREAARAAPSTALQMTQNRTRTRALLYRPSQRHSNKHPPLDISMFAINPRDNCMTAEGKRIIPVFVPYYNEPADELMTTLRSLALQEREVHSDYELRVVVILDGWEKAHITMKAALHHLFNPNTASSSLAEPLACERLVVDSQPEEMILEEIPDWLAPLEHQIYYPLGSDTNVVKEANNRPTTIVVSKVLDNSSLEPQRLDIGEELTLNITLVVKRDNRGKANSQGWFLKANGFARSFGRGQDDIWLLTDGGTLYNHGCLRNLIRYLHIHRHCSAVTGKQRLMTAEEQGRPDESFFSMNWWLRRMVAFDYEAGTACFNPPFAAGGTLPVLPGPLALVRRNAIEGEPLLRYFEIIERPLSQCSMVESLLRLAEDRILTYCLALFGEERWEQGYEAEAVFLFALEDGSKGSGVQRRRWTNGSIGGYLWLLSNWRYILDSQRMSYWGKLALLILCVLQLMVYGVIALAPSLFLLPLRFLLLESVAQATVTVPLHSNATLFSKTLNSTDQVFDDLELIWHIILAFYVFSVVRNATSKQGWDDWIMVILMILGWVAMLTVFIQFGTSLAAFIISKAGFRSLPFTEELGIGLVMVLAGMVLPYLLAFFTSPRSAWIMIKTTIPFYLMLPTMLSWWGSYAFARFWDLSWGNRPRDEGQGMIDSRKEIVRSISYTATACIVFANLFVVALVEVSSDLNRQMYLATLIYSLFGPMLLIMLLSFVCIMVRIMTQTCWKLCLRCCPKHFVQRTIPLPRYELP